MVTLVNRAKMTTATTGTGTITLGSASTGYQTFADAGVADADVVRYVIEDGTDWEIGTGTYTASGTTLTRTVDESTNSDNAITLSGNAVVYVSAAAADVVTPTGTFTLTNKRVNPRVVAASATTGTITPNGDTTDVYKAEGLTGAITIAQPSGTPVDGQKLLIRLEDNGTARAITWTTSAGAFREIGITLPTTTVLGKVTYVGCIYNATDSFWDAVATVTQA
jgi:hypothetical protein